MNAVDREVLALHRELVAIPSVSHDEVAIAARVEEFLRSKGATVERLGQNVVAVAGSGPRLLLNTHLDTVPPAEGWTRDPWAPTVEDGRVFGLGSNDAKASVVSMLAAFLWVAERGGPCEVLLMLVPEEETGGKGTELAWPAVRERGFVPDGVLVGEPTGLEIAVAQKGLLVLKLVAAGDPCHSANAAALGARNPVRTLARDLVALDALDLGPVHPRLGGTTCEPTLLQAGRARNMVPKEATCFLDLRTVPGVEPSVIAARVRERVSASVDVISQRLEPRECPEHAAIVRAAKRARPQASLYGSRTMSDLVYFSGVPAIKCGPGRTERSHTPDEFVLETEILEGYRFYVEVIRAFASEASA